MDGEERQKKAYQSKGVAAGQQLAAIFLGASRALKNAKGRALGMHFTGMRCSAGVTTRNFLLPPAAQHEIVCCTSPSSARSFDLNALVAKHRCCPAFAHPPARPGHYLFPSPVDTTTDSLNHKRSRHSSRAHLSCVINGANLAPFWGLTVSVKCFLK